MATATAAGILLLVFLLLSMAGATGNIASITKSLAVAGPSGSSGDTALDITTAQRHHPLEAIAAVCTTLLLVFALGFSAQALAVYVALATLSRYSSRQHRVAGNYRSAVAALAHHPAVHAIHHSDLQSPDRQQPRCGADVVGQAFGTYTDPADVRIPHFGLEYFHRPADTALAPVLLQPFEYRRGMVYPARDDTGPQVAPSSASAMPGSRPCRQSFIGLTLAVLALWPTMLGLAGIWANSETYQYAWLVIPMFVYTVGWYHRDWILAMTPRPDGLGLLVSVVAVVCWCVAYVVDIRVGQHLALVLVLQGIALSALG